MARLPVPGNDEGTWGDVLNDFLLAAHAADGSLKAGSVGSSHLQSDAVTNATVADGSIAQAKVQNLVSDLASKPDASAVVGLAGSNIATLGSSALQFLRVNIPNDGSDTATWPDRLAFYYTNVRTGYHNEYGELRARPAKSNTVALRAMAFNPGSSGDVFQVSASDAATVYFGVSETEITANLPIVSPHLPRKITTGDTPPVSPQDGDIWFDTSGN